MTNAMVSDGEHCTFAKSAANRPADFSSVDRLLEELQINSVAAKVSLQRQEQILANIKIASRQPATARPLYTRHTLEILTNYSLVSGSAAASKDALRSLANLLLSHVPSRQVAVDLEFGPRIAERFAQSDVDLDQEFLYARLLFLLSYNTSLDFGVLVREYHLAESIITHLDKFAKSTAQLGNVSNPESMAMSEQLRLLFNIVHFFPDLGQHFSPAVPSLCKILLDTDWPTPVLEPPLASVINALLCLTTASGPQASDVISSTATVKDVVRCLVKILDRAMLERKEQDLERGAAPLCTLLRKVYELSGEDVRDEMRTLLLPTDLDRGRPLGQGTSFSARLLRMSGSPLLPTLRENISNLLFELSDKDPERFVYNVGYGYASGFLLSHNIAVPVDGADQETSNHDPINPVTGQKLTKESNNDENLPEMTDEEKEREAERLFVLFERLKATGVVDVKNPVEDYVGRA